MHIKRLAGASVFVGTCSWTDPTLVKEADWYPKRSMTAEERLSFYASRFPIVEADSTYYFPPSPELVRNWAERTPRDFVMSIKAYSLLTGQPTQRRSLWPDIQQSIDQQHQDKKNVYPSHLMEEAMDEVWTRFAHALWPLHETGKLGSVLFQYPSWFVPNRDNRDHIERLRQRLPEYSISVEFRSPRWLSGEDDGRRTLDLLRDNNLAHVVVDAPEVSGLAAVVGVTSALSVIRFHGRNSETWHKKGITAAERFDYLYSRKELQSWVPRIKELADSGAQQIHALMNNCYQDKGVRNAEDLLEMMD